MLTPVPPQAQHRAHHDEGYDLNTVAGLRPKVSEPDMRPREVRVGQDYHGRPYTMTYFHVEEVLASMRTEATLRDHWIDRARAEFADVEQRLCTCTGPCQPPCTKPDPNHGFATQRERVYLHAMDSDVALDAQRRMHPCPEVASSVSKFSSCGLLCLKPRTCMFWHM